MECGVVDDGVISNVTSGLKVLLGIHQPLSLHGDRCFPLHLSLEVCTGAPTGHCQLTSLS